MILNTMNGSEAFFLATEQIINPPQGIHLKQWPIFNDLTGGMREHELTIFCGNTGAGKTQFLANIATQLIQQDQKVFVASVETGAVDFSIRMLSVMVGCDLNTGEAHMSSKFMNTYRDNINSVEKNLFFSSHENRVDVIDMIETLKIMSETKGVKFAIMDNLNFFLKVSKAQDMNLAYDEAIHNFVIAVKKIPIHVFLVMHPKKTESKITQKILSEFDIKGSSTAVQEASNVLLMNRLDESEIPSLGNAYTRELVFKKIRKRGFNVNKKFYLNYEGGAYVEKTITKPVTKSVNTYRGIIQDDVPF